ncbi:hypothetical protein LG325_03325 [Marinobacter nauticus]
MSLFEKVKSGIPTNDQLGKMVADEILTERSPEEVKDNFSFYVNEIHDRIYRRYLEAEYAAGQAVIDELIERDGTVDFNEIKDMMKSLGQSRISRAGKAFEAIFTGLFYKLSYPYSDQVNIDGAKPDFVMPSEEYFRQNPLDSIIFTAKRTLRERWRQVVTEANKGYGFFLATFDDKISANQIDQAARHKIFIVVTDTMKNAKPHYRDAFNVLTFEDFFKRYLDPAMTRWADAGYRSS